MLRLVRFWLIQGFGCECSLRLCDVASLLGLVGFGGAELVWVAVARCVGLVGLWLVFGGFVWFP